MNFKEPTNAKEVRIFLGFVNILLGFLYTIFHQTAKFRKLTQENIKWKWVLGERTTFNWKNIAIIIPCFHISINPLRHF